MKKINWANEIKSTVKKIIHRELRDLSNPELNKHVLVHESRKRVKNLRAILKLIKFVNGDTKIKLINNKLKNLNSRSASTRRAFVLMQICENLNNTKTNNSYADLLKEFQSYLLDLIESSNPKYNINQLLTSYNDVFIKLDKEFDNLRFESEDFSILKSGLASIYDRGRKFYKISTQQQEVIIFHELRKNAKDLFYSLETIQRCWPPVIKSYNNQIKILTDHIGDMHDLYELKQELNKKIWNNYKTAKENLFLIIDKKINSEINFVLSIADKIYVEKTTDFIGRFSKLAKFELQEIT